MRSLLQKVQCKSASFDERRIYGNGQPDAVRYARWVDRTTRDEESFAELLRTRGVGLVEAQRQVSEVQEGVVPETSWLHALRQLFSVGSSAPSGAVASLEENPRYPFAGSLVSLLGPASQWLSSEIARSGLRVSEQAQVSLLAWLSRRLLDTTQQVLVVELRLENEAEGKRVAPTVFAHEIKRDDWEDLLGVYPVLGRLVGTLYSQWMAAVSELVLRIRQDLSLLTGQFGLASPEVTDLELGLGDAHQHGRTVGIVRFGETHVLYKTKELDVSAWFLRLARELERAGDLRICNSQRVIPREGYAWEEYLVRGDCTRQLALSQAGRSLRLLEYCRGKDFHAENVRLSPAGFCLLDLEALLQPRLPLWKEGLLPAEPIRAYEDSPLPTGFLPSWAFGEPTADAVPKGGLTLGGDFTTPHRVRCLQNSSSSDISFAWAHSPYRDDSTIPASEGPLTKQEVELLVSGYREVDYLLRANSELLERSLRDAEAIKVRVVPRNTRLYSDLRFESCSPALLLDGRDRDIHIEGLFQGARGCWPPLVMAVESEVRAIRRLDIPLFWARPAAHTLFTEEGEIAGFFPQSAVECISTRGMGGLDRNCDAIRTSVACVYPPPPEAERTSVPPLSGPRCLHEAISGIAELVVSNVELNNGNPIWLGVREWPAPGSPRGLAGLPPDLLSGSAGLAIFLASLKAVDLASEGSEQLLRQVVTFLLDALDSTLDAFDLDETVELNPSALTGVGSQLYALRCVARLGSHSELEAIATDRATKLPLGRLPEKLPLDLNGIPGLMLSLAGANGRDVSVVRQLLAEHLRVDRSRHQPREWQPTMPSPRTVLRLVTERCDEASATLGCSEAFAEMLAGQPTRSLSVGDQLAAVSSGLEFSRPSPSNRLHALEVLTARRPAANESRGEVERHALEWIALQQSTGSWFPETGVSDRHNLSAMFGVAAVGCSFVNFLSGSALGSLRLLEFPNILPGGPSDK